MKDLEKWFMVIAFVSALLSLTISIYEGCSWIWQSITMVWIGVAFLKHLTIEKINKN
jgi:hypothetical protein